MEKRIVVATHGRFSEGILTSMKMIFGDQTPIECITAYVDSDTDYQELLTDVLGGSVNNEFTKLLDEYPFHLVCGLNLALLLEVAVCPADTVSEQLPGIVERARDGIALVNGLVESTAETDANEF